MNSMNRRNWMPTARAGRSKAEPWRLHRTKLTRHSTATRQELACQGQGPWLIRTITGLKEVEGRGTVALGVQEKMKLQEKESSASDPLPIAGGGFIFLVKLSTWEKHLKSRAFVSLTTKRLTSLSYSIFLTVLWRTYKVSERTKVIF